MVPVLDQQNKPLFPCKERRAKALMKRGDAVAYWQKGIFCIKLTRQETEKREEYPAIVLGIDPGSRREGYTVATTKDVVLNITTNTPYWVKEHVETRRNLRRARRYRKTPYRQCRKNRAPLRSNRISPSTKARWDAKLRMTKLLQSIIPITIINVEDIKAISKEGKTQWNRSFSLLEVGKTWFYNELEKLGLKLLKTSGKQTKTQRVSRSFNKSKDKFSYVWEAHNVDSHCLTEIALNKQIEPYLGLWRLEYLQFHRRQLHVQNYAKGHIRRPEGKTISLGMRRGSIVQYKDRLCYLGGSRNGRLSLHSILTGKRFTQEAQPRNVEKLYTSSMRVQFLSQAIQRT